MTKSGECNALKWLSSIRECGRLRIALAENLFSVPRFAIPYESGPGRSVFVKNALLEAVALDKTFYLSQSDVPDKYVSASYDRDFGSILRSVAGAGSLFEPPPLAMHETKSLMLAWTHSFQSSRTVVHRHLRGRFARTNSTPVRMMSLFLGDFCEAREPDDVSLQSKIAFCNRRTPKRFSPNKALCLVG